MSLTMIVSDSNEVIPRLVQIIREKKHSGRAWALWVLAQTQAKEAVPSLIAMLDESDDELRDLIQRTLDRIQTEGGK